MSTIPPPPPPVAGTSGALQPKPLSWGDPEEPFILPSSRPRDIEEQIEELELEYEPGKDQWRQAVRDVPTPRRVNNRVSQLLRGEISVEDLDDDELARGQLRGKDGKFRGRASSVVPKVMHDEMVRRLLSRGTAKMQGKYLAAIDVLTTVMEDSTIDASQRLKAVDMLMTRVAGKPIDVVKLSVEIKPWENALKGIIRQVPAELGEINAATVSESDYHDEDDDDDDDR